MTGLKLIGYLRVSTKGQAEDGFGLEDQQTKITAWARANGHLICWIADEGLSGTLLPDDRPGMKATLDAIETRQVHGFVTLNTSRLARELGIQEYALRRAWDVGGRTFTVGDGELKPSARGARREAHFRKFKGLLDEIDRDNIVDRLQDGRAAKAARGGYAYGQPPMGVRAKKIMDPVTGKQTSVLIADQREQTVIARIVELDGDDLTLREIISVLDAEGIRPKREGSRWHPSTVARILTAAKRDSRG